MTTTRMMNVSEILYKNRYDKSKHPRISHTRIANSENGISGGSYYMSGDTLQQFYQMYYNHIIENNRNEYLTEKQSENGLMYVDLDFNYAELGRHHTKDTIEMIVCEYLTAMKKYLYFDENTHFNIYVMERKKPYFNGKKYKDGLHIIFCIKMRRIIQLCIRQDVMESIDFSGLPLINSLDDVFDEGITLGNTNLQLLGSRKSPDIEPYYITTKIAVSYDENDDEFITSFSNDIEMSIDLFKEVSCCESNVEHILETAVGFNIDNRLPTKKQYQQEIGGDSSPRSVIIDGKEEYTQEYMNNGRLLVKALENNMLSKQANSSGMPWREVGLKIKSVFGDTPPAWDLFDAFCQLGKLTGKYDRIENRTIWDGFKVNDDYNNFGIIVNLLKADNEELYYKIKKEMDDIAMKPALENMILEMQKSEEQLKLKKEQVKIINNKYFISTDDLDDTYATSAIISNTLKNTLKLCKENWYMLTESNLWKQQKEPSKYIIAEVRKYIDESNKAVVLRISQLDGEAKEKQIEISKKYLKSYKIINGTGYLNVLTRFLRTSLADDSFADKLDSNVGYLAFKNGIVDLKTKEFRKGILSEDYITQTVPYDYNDKSTDFTYLKSKLKEILNNNDEHLEYFLSIIGHSFIGDPEKEKSIYFMIDKTDCGKGNNGKTFFFDILSVLLPNYVYKSGSSLIDKNNKKIHKQLTMMKGKRLVWLDEIPKDKDTNSALMKEIGDGKQIENEIMYGTSETIPLMFKMFALSNFVPKISAEEQAVYNRYKQVSFNSHFDQTGSLTEAIPSQLKFIADTGLPDEIKTQRFNEVFSLIVHYSNLYYTNNNKLPAIPYQFKKDTLSTQLQNDKFGTWFNKNMIADATGKIPIKLLMRMSNMNETLVREGMSRMNFKYNKDLMKMGKDEYDGKYYKGGFEGVSIISDIENDEEENDEE